MRGLLTTAMLCALATPAMGAVVKSKSGRVAYVSERAAPSFQCLIDKLEAAGYPINDMGGYAHRRNNYSLHPSGNAIDINQIDRNVVTAPLPKNHIAIATSCGLVDGAQWDNNPDQGHWQVGGWAGARYTAPKPLATWAGLAPKPKPKPEPKRIDVAKAQMPEFSDKVLRFGFTALMSPDSVSRDWRMFERIEPDVRVVVASVDSDFVSHPSVSETFDDRFSASFHSR